MPHKANIRFLSLAISTATVLLLGGSREANGQATSGQLPGNVHYLHSGDLPPGFIGGARLQRRGAVQGYYQPVRLSGPEGVRLSLADGTTFPPTEAGALHAGLLIGAVYRIRITDIADSPGLEIYPSVEVIDRTYPPPGEALRFPIPINIDRLDLLDASQGRMVTRVIYLEDSEQALPLAETIDSARTLEISSREDPLKVADRLGRPVAIVRIGSLLPPAEPSLLPQFFFGSPPWLTMTPIQKQQEPANALPVGESKFNFRQQR